MQQNKRTQVLKGLGGAAFWGSTAVESLLAMMEDDARPQQSYTGLKRLNRKKKTPSNCQLLSAKIPMELPSFFLSSKSSHLYKDSYSFHFLLTLAFLRSHPSTSPAAPTQPPPPVHSVRRLPGRSPGRSAAPRPPSGWHPGPQLSVNLVNPTGVAKVP